MRNYAGDTGMSRGSLPCTELAHHGRIVGVFFPTILGATRERLQLKTERGLLRESFKHGMG